ncbi:hypothetical protein K503DRAFT_185773 [Rhizopogon vinicolor AM-OR11-026]|uniref:Uncharacterized protein n=1 Tax=Rhizopogon vinicolor AM-OR11-026 TaxID=1314800 RepID=A0A1B7MZS2_9AGAM|nr:hypothetical protein K503DRAFT_185773 [Rhizopogon vinicolor AM-OR11-026]
MDRLPHFPPPSPPYLWEDADNSDIDVSFSDGRFTCMCELGVPRQLQYCPGCDPPHMYSHGGSQEDVYASPPIATRAWETSSNHSFEDAPFLAPNHGQCSYATTAVPEYPGSDIPRTSSPGGSLYSLPVSDSSFTTPSPISRDDSICSSMIPYETWHHQLSPHSVVFEESSPEGDLTHESTQSDWAATSVDLHALPVQFAPCLPPPSVPLQSPMPFSGGEQDLLNEDQASDEVIFVEEHEMHCCPLLTSDGKLCSTLIPCEEAPLMAHLRGTHSLRAKRTEVIYCPWPGCTSRIQAASTPRHIITLHVKKRVRCSYCGKSLTRKDGKAKHEKICLSKP